MNAEDLKKLVTLIQNQIQLGMRELSALVMRKWDENSSALKEVAQTQKRIADALEKQKTQAINVEHQVKIPEIVVPEPKVTVNVPEIKLPKFEIPEIKIPPIKLPTINVPKPEVTVHIDEREDKAETKLLTEISQKLDKLGAFDIWDQIGKKTPLPVILVSSENLDYYDAKGGGSGGAIVMSAGAPGTRQLNNTVFGSSRATVTTAGTSIQLPDQPCSEVTITALESNTDVVTVGGSNVLGAKSGRIGQPLEPLQSYTIKIDNLKKIFLDSVVSGEGVSYTYVA